MSLELVSIGVSFAGRRVLDDGSLTVPTGHTLAVRGPSGVGKSTLLRVVSGLLAPDHGRVLIDDRDVTSMPTHRRSVGFVFQDSQLFPHLDVAGNVAFGLRMQKLERSLIDAAVTEWLTRVGLADRAHQDVRTLSGGETRRVALARALAPRPRVLLLDEPFSGLDNEMRIRLAELVHDLLHDTDTTALLVSHDDDDVRRVADSVLRLAAAADGST
ncbi:MAG: ABC transporter ATP-binding protein [Actinomycetota bacterium]